MSKNTCIDSQGLMIWAELCKKLVGFTTNSGGIFKYEGIFSQLWGYQTHRGALHRINQREEDDSLECKSACSFKYRGRECKRNLSVLLRKVRSEKSLQSFFFFFFFFFFFVKGTSDLRGTLFTFGKYPWQSLFWIIPLKGNSESLHSVSSPDNIARCFTLPFIASSFRNRWSWWKMSVRFGS